MATATRRRILGSPWDQFTTLPDTNSEFGMMIEMLSLVTISVERMLMTRTSPSVSPTVT